MERIACPRKGCRGYTPHSKLRHWLPFVSTLQWALWDRWRFARERTLKVGIVGPGPHHLPVADGYINRNYGEDGND